MFAYSEKGCAILPEAAAARVAVSEEVTPEEIDSLCASSGRRSGFLAAHARTLAAGLVLAKGGTHYARLPAASISYLAPTRRLSNGLLAAPRHGPGQAASAARNRGAPSRPTRSPASSAPFGAFKRDPGAALGHDQPVEASYDRSALRPAVEASPKVSLSGISAVVSQALMGSSGSRQSTTTCATRPSIPGKSQK
jgi:hypothetical protein